MFKSIVPQLGALALGLAAFAAAGTASAADLTFTNTTDGATTGTDPYTLTSTDSTYSILRFINNEAVTFGNLTSLSLDYEVIEGGVAAGAPRIVVVTNGGFFYIHLGPAGSFADASLGAQSSGNLLAQNDVGRYDLGGIGGSAYTNYSAALALAGSQSVLRFSVVVDSFGGNDREIVIGSDGLQASGTVPEPATWALMILGFGAAGAALRGRRAVTLSA